MLHSPIRSPRSENGLEQHSNADEPKKRKKKFAHKKQPTAKRNKDASFKERYKYVLALKQSDSSDSDSEEPVEPIKKVKDASVRTIKKAKRSTVQLEPAEEALVPLGADEEAEVSSSDSCFSYDDSQSFSSDDTSDSDYQGDEDSDNNFTFERYRSKSSLSSDDPDYEPQVEDMNVSTEQTVMLNASGLEHAFENSDSEVKNVNEFDVEMTDDSNDTSQSLAEIWESMRMEVGEPSKPKYVRKISMDEVSEEEEILELEFSKLLQRSTFYECIDNGSLVKFNDTIHFHGILDIRPLINSVQINGYTIETGESALKASSISHADYFLNLTPVINGPNHKVDENKLIEEIKKLMPDVKDIKEFLKGFDLTKDVLIYLRHSTPSSAIEMINHYCTSKVLPSKALILKNSPNPSSEHFLDAKFFVNEENPRLNCYLVNEDWKHIDLKYDSKTVIVGGKNVGKSALAQYAINSNIKKFQKILLIDLDIGQPICGVAQTVSATVIDKPLIGAGYLSKLNHEKCFLYGDKSIMTKPYKYIECVKKLVQFCIESEDYMKMPWVINTMGYQKGFGLELIAILLRIIQPTDVVQIQHANSKYNFDDIINENMINNIVFSFIDEEHLDGISMEAFFTTHVLDSLVNNSNKDLETRDGTGKKWISNATEKRKMSLLAQLSVLTHGGQPYLNDVTPSCSSIRRIRMIAIDKKYEISQGVANTNLFNGNLVYLCNCPEVANLMPNSVLDCHGLGLVRAIDNIHELIYILTPHDEEKLSVNTLALGYLHLPSEIIVKQNFEVSGKIPYVAKHDAQTAKHVNKRNIKDIF